MINNEQRIKSIRDTLSNQFSPTEIEIIDDSHEHVGHAGARAGGGHFTVRLVSNLFTGKSLIERHRMIYKSLEQQMKTDIHALSIQAYTESEIQD
jgi:BolA protein